MFCFLALHTMFWKICATTFDLEKLMFCFWSICGSEDRGDRGQGKPYSVFNSYHLLTLPCSGLFVLVVLHILVVRSEMDSAIPYTKVS